MNDQRIEWPKVFRIVVLVVSIYISAAYFAYWMRHPDLTEMQVFMSFRDAMAWR